MASTIQNYEPIDMTGKIRESDCNGHYFWYGWLVPSSMAVGVEMNLSSPYNSYEEAEKAQLELLVFLKEIEITNIFAVDSENEAHEQLLIKKFTNTSILR